MPDILLFIESHWTVSLAIVVVLFLLLIVELVHLKRRAAALSPAAAVRLINHQNAVVIDIRSPETFTTGHIVEAISLPLADLNEKNKKLEKFKSQPIIFVCATGIDSSRAANKLKEQGWNNIHCLTGGIQAWRNAEMPLIKGLKS